MNQVIYISVDICSHDADKCRHSDTKETVCVQYCFCLGKYLPKMRDRFSAGDLYLWHK